MKDKEKAVKRIARSMRKYYFEILDENTLKSRDGIVYHWNSKRRKKLNLTLREAMEKVMEGISRYFVERTTPNQWGVGEKLFHGYNFPYKPGIGSLAASFPEGLIRMIGRYVIPTGDILSFARKFYLSFPLPKRKFYLELLKEIEKGIQEN